MEFPGHFQTLFQQLNQQRLQSSPLCDCRVQVAGCSFRAHSSVLAACSSHLRALLHSTEPGGGVNLTLDCEVVTPEAFSTLLEMVYTSRLPLRTSNAMDVLLAASHLHLTAVVRACKLYLSTRSFPTAPPRGWRSSGGAAAAEQQQSGAFLQRNLLVQHVDLSVDEELPDGLEMEVSQSGGGGDSRVQGEGPRSRKRRRRDSGSPTVSASRAGEEAELQLPLPEEEEKYELPSQSHHSSSLQEEEVGGASVVKVKVGEEGGGVEVKQEEMSCSSSPLGGDGERPDASDRQELPTATSGDDLQTCVGESRPAGGADESLDDDGEALDSLSELAFCFLNPPRGSCDASCDLGVIESLEAEQSLARLTAAAVTAATESLARFTANANEGLAQLNADANEGYAHLDANANEGLAQIDANAEESLAQLDANDGLAHLEASEGLAHLDATASQGLSTLTGGTANANDGLAYLNTATSTSSTAASAVETASEQMLTPEATLSAEAATNSFSSSPSSVGFPAVASVPFRRCGFADTLILRPAPPLKAGGFLVPPTPPPTAAAGASGSSSSRGATAFRRIAPKMTAPPAGAEDPDPDPSPSCSDGARPVLLTRASDDVLSKCKKAASEDNVLLVDGERKYACGLCGKTFTNLTDCKKHIRVHTGEKPYPCTACGKRFSQSSHLYKHSKNTCLTWTHPT